MASPWTPHAAAQPGADAGRGTPTTPEMSNCGVTVGFGAFGPVSTLTFVASAVLGYISDANSAALSQSCLMVTGWETRTPSPR